jgi:hypothetical protein
VSPVGDAGSLLIVALILAGLVLSFWRQIVRVLGFLLLSVTVFGFLELVMQMQRRA